MPHEARRSSSLLPTTTPAYTSPETSSTDMLIDMVPTAYAFHPSSPLLVPVRFTVAGTSVVVLVSTTSMGARSAPMYARSRSLSSAMSCIKNRSVPQRLQPGSGVVSL